MLRFSDASDNKEEEPAREDYVLAIALDQDANREPRLCGASESLRASELYGKTTRYLVETFEKIKQRQTFSIDEGCRLVDEIVESPVTRDEWYEMINGITCPIESDIFLVLHHANVAIYTICVSITLNFTREEQVRVGLAALLHDIGKIFLSEDILCKDGELTPKEREKLKQYPLKSYEILNSLGPEYGLFAECAMQVNERIDGSGFPRGIRKNLIHDYAQIIGLVDVYEAMTSSRPYRKRWLHYDALWEILKRKKNAFHHSYIKALLQTFSIFRLNSYVRLNSGVIGRIIEVHENLPMRPKIEILYDSEYNRLPNSHVIDLMKEPVFYIVAPVAESELNME